MHCKLLATALLLLTTSAAVAEDGVSPVQATDPTAETIILASERYQRLTVPVTIAGRGPYRFMIDTGAQATVLSRDLADLLQLADRRPATLVGMASTRAAETVGIADFKLGRRSFYIRTAPLVEAAHIGGADGILGLDSLQDQRVLLDFAKRQLLVADAADLGGNTGFDIVVKARQKLGQLIIADARIDGVKVAVIVDTGAQGSIGNPALMARLTRARTIGETSMTDVNGQELRGQVRLARELQLDRATLRNIALLFADSPTFRVLGLADRPAMVLGMQELQLFRRVAIDFRTRRVLFEMPHDAPAASPYPDGHFGI
ncbi:MAG: hypothetical protein RLZZ08_415 [Pseudomonadota bacterium]|jgi:predicted aspartyl protease